MTIKKFLLSQVYNGFFPASLLLLFIIMLLIPAKTEAMPVFARKYNMSCNTCHAAYPKLNAFGEQFAADNMTT